MEGQYKAYKDDGGGITERSLAFWDANKGKIGKVNAIEVGKEPLVKELGQEGYEVEYNMIITGTEGAIWLSGCACGYPGEGSTGTEKIFKDLGVQDAAIKELGIPISDYLHLTFTDGEMKETTKRTEDKSKKPSTFEIYQLATQHGINTYGTPDDVFNRLCEAGIITNPCGRGRRSSPYNWTVAFKKTDMTTKVTGFGTADEAIASATDYLRFRINCGANFPSDMVKLQIIDKKTNEPVTPPMRHPLNLHSYWSISQLLESI